MDEWESTFPKASERSSRINFIPNHHSKPFHYIQQFPFPMAWERSIILINFTYPTTSERSKLTRCQLLPSIAWFPMPSPPSNSNSPSRSAAWRVLTNDLEPPLNPPMTSPPLALRTKVKTAFNSTRVAWMEQSSVKWLRCPRSLWLTQLPMVPLVSWISPPNRAPVNGLMWIVVVSSLRLKNGFDSNPPSPRRTLPWYLLIDWWR